MTQPPANQDWPAWLNLLWGVLALPAAWGWRWLTSRVSRDELEGLIKGQNAVWDARREIDDQRYQEKIRRFDEIDKVMAETRDRVSHIEGSISGSYRRLT